MVKLEVQEVTEENIKFTLSNTTLAFANALRRVMIAEIPTFAIDIVQFDKNYTVIPEEMTTDRLGLIPIESSEVDKYLYPADCMCKEYCSQCSIIITLDVINTRPVPWVVTSKQLFVENGPLVGDPVYPSLITRLGLNQSIKCRCIAIKGKGETHSKWSPVTAVAFGYDSENKHRHTRYWYEQDVNKEWPLPWFAKEGDKPQSEETNLKEEPSTFYFDVEVVRGCLKPMDVLTKSIQILTAKLRKIHSAIDEYN
ncbi:DNA-directed RNA polymerase II subunit RPB3 [Nematocida sp. AWRm80]|nr:DNA-directed RNA polymerase II subunit RPB3 [Nematocida sp. AWRm80]